MVKAILCAVLGVIAGLSSGLFGIGGGIIIVPALIFMLSFSQHKAQGTSLAALLAPVGILAVIEYYRAGNADLFAGGFIALGYLGGALVGTRIALGLQADDMRRYFGVFMIALGIYFVVKR